MKTSVIILLCIIDYILGLPDCTDPWLNFKGYTYSVDPESKDRIWSHCKFPNPTSDLSRCGFLSLSGPAYICDPDGVLSTTANALIKTNKQLISIQENTSTLCENSERQRQSYIVSIALVDRLRLADLQDSNSCINDCNEIHPTLNITARTPTDDEVNTMMANFANSLRTSWSLGACENDVVIFYSKRFNKIYTSVGAKVENILTESTLASLHANFLKYVSEGRIEEGLLVFVEEVRTRLRSFTPAHILLLINMLVIILLVLFFILFLHVNDVELNVWGNDKQWFVFDVIVKFVTGVWILQAVFITISNVLNKLTLWATVICAIAAAGCLAIYFQEDFIFPSRVFSDKVNFTG